MANKSFVVKNGLVVGQDAEINGTGAIKIPAGTEDQRPSPVAGQIRFNTDTNAFEGYNGQMWGALADGAEIDPAFVQAISSIAITNDTTKLDRRKNLSDVSSTRQSRTNLLPVQTGNENKFLFTDGNDVVWDDLTRISDKVQDNLSRTIGLLAL